MATTDNVLSDLIINDLTQEEYDALVASGEVQEGQIYATDGTGSSGGGSTTGGLESVAHDSSLEGAGTTASPLKVASTVIAQINDKADGTVVETLSSVVSENTTKLNTLRNDTDSLGDQVSGIEEKIPSSASATNQLATKADLPIGFDATVVDQLPATGEKGIIYLVPKNGEAPDIHDEYIWIDSEQKFEFIGSTAVDLTDYVKNTDYAQGAVGGVVKASSYYACGTNATGFLLAATRPLSDYANMDNSAFIGKGTLENVKNNLVKRAVTENDITLTDEEKTAAQDWLGIKQGASLPILMAIWSDHVINDMSWLHAGTFSWQSGDVYVAAYEHLTADFAGLAGTKYYAWTRNAAGDVYYTLSASPKSGQAIYYKNASGEMVSSGIVMEGGSQTIYNDGGDELVRDSTKDETVPQKQTDTIGDITISYYLAEDGHKICLPDQESNIAALYEATGVAWYFILDTANEQFKLPRAKPLSGAIAGNGMALGLTNGTNNAGLNVSTGTDNKYLYIQEAYGKTVGTTTGSTVLSTTDKTAVGIATDSTKSGIVAERENTDQYKYLYFYVGNFAQEATEQTAGLNAELFNGKADTDLSNIPSNYDYIIERQESSAENNYTWYFKFKSGCVIMGGLTNSVTSTGQINCSATVPVPVITVPTLLATPIYISGASVSVVTSYRSGNTIYVTLEKNWSGSAASTTARARWFAVGIAE